MGMKEAHKLPEDPQERLDYLRDIYGFGPLREGEFDTINTEGTAYFCAKLIDDSPDEDPYHAVQIIPINPDVESGEYMVDWVPEQLAMPKFIPPKWFIEKLQGAPDPLPLWREFIRAEFEHM